MKELKFGGTLPSVWGCFPLCMCIIKVYVNSAVSCKKYNQFFVIKNRVHYEK